MSQLAGKCALVLGADAIGAGIALRFAREGATLAVLDSDLALADAVVSAIRAAGGSALALSVDWNATAAQAVNEAAGQLGGIHVLVNNVLPLPHVGLFEDQSAETFASAFARIQAAVAAMQAALPYMQAAGGGRIINVGQRYGESANEGIAAYNAAAWSLVGITRTAATDWGQYQIATNLLLPLAETPEYHRYHQRRARVLDMMVGQLPLGRLGDPVEDIGAAALFLAGDACNFVNGEVIHGDGGQHIAGPVVSPGRFPAMQVG